MSQKVRVEQLKPATINNYVVTTSGGTVVWAPATSSSSSSGPWTASTGVNSATLIGSNSIASGTLSVSEGSGSTSSGVQSHAGGYYTKAIGDNSFTMGMGTTAYTNSSVALGVNSIAGASETIPVSTLFVVSSAITMSVDPNYGQNSVTFSGIDVSIEWYSYIFSYAYPFLLTDGVNFETIDYTVVTDVYYDIGTTSTYIPISSTATTYTLITGNTYYDVQTLFSRPAFASGTNVKALGVNSHAEGFETKALGNASHAEGFQTDASNTASHAEGYLTKALGYASHTEGFTTYSVSDYSHAQNYQTRAGWRAMPFNITTGTCVVSDSIDYTSIFPGGSVVIDQLGVYSYGSTAYIAPDFFIYLNDTAVNGFGLYIADTNYLTEFSGVTNNQLGPYAHAEGLETRALGNEAHAEGYVTYAIGHASHAEGYATTAVGQYSHAEGLGSLTGPVAYGSHAGGFYTNTQGQYSFVHGQSSVAAVADCYVFGIGISGTNTNTLYTPYLNIGLLGAGTSINNLGIDANGNVVVGSLTGGGSFTGNTYASCITDLYVTNLWGCPGDTIYVQQNGGNVSIGTTASTAVLTVAGSGTTQPIFRVQGSQGELFAVNDSLIGSLFSVNDISGLPILEVFSNDTILMGSYVAPSLNTTAKVTANSGVTTNIYSIAISAYTGAFFEYTVNSGTNYRAGSIMSVWDTGTSANYTETSTADLGVTTDLILSVTNDGTNANLIASATTNNWIVKTIVRSI